MLSKQTSLILGTSVLMITLSLLAIAPIVSNEVFAGGKHNDHGKKGSHSHHKSRHHSKFNDCNFNHRNSHHWNFNHWKFNDCNFNHWKFNHR